jgi:hypothetical protein
MASFQWIIQRVVSYRLYVVVLYGDFQWQFERNLEERDRDIFISQHWLEHRQQPQSAYPNFGPSSEKKIPSISTSEFHTVILSLCDVGFLGL